MVKYNEISNLSDAIGEGFFADRVVRILAQRKHADAADVEVLERILRFTEKIQKGQHQVNTGRLSSDAVESIGAYHRAIVTLQALMRRTEEVTEKKLDELLKSMRKEVEDTLGRRVIVPSKVKKTRTFFESIQRGTLSEVGEYYGSRIEVLKWPKRAP